jgi:hypothetical protein
MKISLFLKQSMLHHCAAGSVKRGQNNSASKTFCSMLKFIKKFSLTDNAVRAVYVVSEVLTKKDEQGVNKRIVRGSCSCIF